MGSSLRTGSRQPHEGEQSAERSDGPGHGSPCPALRRGLAAHPDWLGRSRGWTRCGGYARGADRVGAHGRAPGAGSSALGRTRLTIGAASNCDPPREERRRTERCPSDLRARNLALATRAVPRVIRVGPEHRDLAAAGRTRRSGLFPAAFRRQPNLNVHYHVAVPDGVFGRRGVSVWSASPRHRAHHRPRGRRGDPHDAPPSDSAALDRRASLTRPLRPGAGLTRLASGSRYLEAVAEPARQRRQPVSKKEAAADA